MPVPAPWPAAWTPTEPVEGRTGPGCDSRPMRGALASFCYGKIENCSKFF